MKRRDVVRCVTKAAVAWLSAVSLIGCKPHPEGITDLVGVGYSYVGFPGTRVLDVGAKYFAWDAAANDSSTGLAITEAGELVIGDFATQSHCSAGPAASFRQSYYYMEPQSAETRWVPYLRDVDAEGWGTLAFTTQDCSQQVLGPSQVKFLNLGQATRFNPPQLLVQGRSAPEVADGPTTLLACDPNRETDPCSVLGGVYSVKYRNGQLWTIEAVDGVRRLVQRNEAMEIAQEKGVEVTDFMLGGPGDAMAFADDAGITLLSQLSDPSSPPDGCELAPVLSRSRPNWGVTYRSPCDNGPLFLYGFERGESIELAPGAVAPVILESGTKESTVAIYLTDPADLVAASYAETWPSLAAGFRMSYRQEAPSTVGTLAVTTLEGDTLLGPSGVWLGGVGWSYGTRVRVLSDFDGKRGTLVDWNILKNSVTEVATNVTDFSWRTAVVQVDESRSNFVETRPEGGSTVKVKNVQDRGAERWQTCSLGSIDCLANELASDPSELHAVVSDVDSNGGDLWLMGRRDTREELSAPEFLDDLVYPSDYAFLFGGDAVLYLRKVDTTTGAGTLTARFVKTFDAFEVAHVTNWREIDGEYPGIFYNTRKGSKSAFWFARLH